VNNIPQDTSPKKIDKRFFILGAIGLLSVAIAIITLILGIKNHVPASDEYWNVPGVFGLVGILLIYVCIAGLISKTKFKK
jgi:hypothetical protein